MATITITASNNRVAASTGDVVILPLIGDNITDSVWITVSGSVTLRPSGSDKIDGTQGDVTITADSQYTNTGSSSWYIVNPVTDGGGVTDITGTANQVIASSSTGSVTLSTPQSIGTTSSPTFSSLTLGASGLNIADGSGDLLNFSAGTQTANRTLTAPTLTDNDTIATLGVANIFTAAVTLPADGLKIKDASGDTVTVSAGTQSADRTFNLPTISNTATLMVANNATSNQTISNGMLFGSSLFVGTGANTCNIRVSVSQSGNGTPTFPVIPSGTAPVIYCGFSGTTSAMSGGTVTVNNTNVRTGDLIFATRISGSSTSSGIHDYTISNATSFTLNANDATDNGVWAYMIVKP